MRASQDFINQLELLFETYEQEVTDKLKRGVLKASAAKTYLYHSGNFIKWCRNDFVPGAKNERKQ
ncbi:hypothetical protein [Paenibacillus sp. S150]|uniref:hypothetical protein n=1 Tax=Paenibacillus sp. S150 TaxID=2749826 RepID=UPI001C56D213|nr:hypothetical protein [Paenibacillus sp. S150]MBW4080262.1 hypothetical protein [Paenibacillus sp. S150]